jgi:hypothetical protein
MTLFPREHGAYGQMAFPLVTSFAVAGISAPAVLTGLAVVAGFLAHEPLLVVLGRRGVRVRRERSRAGTLWLAAASATMAGAGLFALWLMPPSTRWSFLLPLVPGTFLAVAIAANCEKTLFGEIAVALAFSLMAVPLCLAAGGSIGVAFAVGIAFASIFVTGTLAVHGVVLAVRGGGHPRAACAARLAVLILTTLDGVALAAMALVGLLPWTTLMAAAPGLLAAAWMAVFPPAPARLRTIGWTLVTTSASAALILFVGLGSTW